MRVMINYTQEEAKKLAADVLKAHTAQKKISRVFDFVVSQISTIVELEKLGYSTKEIAEIYKEKNVNISLASWKLYIRKAKDASRIKRRTHKGTYKSEDQDNKNLSHGTTNVVRVDKNGESEVRTLSSLTEEEETICKKIVEGKKRLEELKKNKVKESVLRKQEEEIRRLEKEQDRVDEDVRKLQIPGVLDAGKRDTKELMGQTEFLTDVEVRGERAHV